MNEPSLEKKQRIVSTSLYQIDVENQNCQHIPISGKNNELENYLSELLAEIKSRPQKRAYDFIRETTELFTALKDFYLLQDFEKTLTSSNIANRLLDKETKADKRYGHLNATGSGHVKKGSFLQFMYRDGTSISYLGVKIDHQSILDETDFIKRAGLSLTNKIYKACWVSFDETGLPNEVFVYDTNAKPSVYWWEDFLELKELRNNSFNTKTAIEEVVRTIGYIKKEFSSDYTLLRNASIAAFKQNGEMDFDSFITNTFANYVPENTDLAAKIPDLVTKLRLLPEKKKFDTAFTLDPSAVSFKKTRIPLSREISLSMEEGIENIDTKIWSELTTDGRKLVVINSPTGYSQFTLKERDK